MKKQIFCIKLKKKANSLPFIPINNDLGKKIFNNISEEAWNEWLNYQTMLINEYQLDLLSNKSQEFLLKEMEKYFFFSDK